MRGLNRTILNWCDKTFEKALEEDNQKKVVLSGFVEGVIDGALIMYIPVTIACFVWKKKALKK